MLEDKIQNRIWMGIGTFETGFGTRSGTMWDNLGRSLTRERDHYDLFNAKCPSSYNVLRVNETREISRAITGFHVGPL